VGKENGFKGSYGLDAPNVVRNLIVIGALLIAAAAVVGTLLAGVWFAVLAAWLGLIGVVCGAEAVWMIWSSNKGKMAVVRRLVAALPLRPDDRALDVGCGRGLVLHAVAKRLPKGEAVGIDIWNSHDQSGNSPEATLRNAALEGVADRVRVVNADMRRLPFADSSFAAVTSSLAIHNLAGREDRRQAVAEIARVLQPGGTVALLDFRNTKEYAEDLSRAGLRDVHLSGLRLAMFPPVRIVTARKPANGG